MKVSQSIALAGAAATVASATPVKRAVTDGDILNYALTLEHLEATLYAQGLANFTQEDFQNAGFADPFYTNLKSVASDEATHVEFLTSALKSAGVPPTAACTYSFPITDPKSFVTVASILEGVGVSAYLGAAASIANKAYLTAAGSILTVEARHSSYIRAALGEVPFPQAFDDPLDFDEVYTLAAPFIASCPSSNPALPVKAFPSLTVTSTGTVDAGSQITVATGKGYTAPSGTVYAAFITVTGPVWTPVTAGSDGTYTVTVPTGVAGQSYLVLTNSKSSVTDDDTVAGPALVEIGATVGVPSGNCGSSSSASATATPTTNPSGVASPTTGSTSTTTSSTTPPLFTGAASTMKTSALGLGSAVVAAFFLA